LALVVWISSNFSALWILASNYSTSNSEASLVAFPSSRLWIVSMQALASAAISSTISSVSVLGSSSSGYSSALANSSPIYLSCFSTTDSGSNPIVSPTIVSNFSSASWAS